MSRESRRLKKLFKSSLITVILPVYNGEKWLAESISSILNQTYLNLELLIINDGSKDKSLEIIEKFSKVDNRINYYSQQNLGLTKSLNKGIKLAKGDWLARIDSDDKARPRRLELQIDYAKKNDLGLVGCQSNIINPEGLFKSHTKIPISHKKLCINLYKQKPVFSHSSVLFKKELAISLGGYRETMQMAQDYDLWLRISEVSKIGAIKYTGILIREHKSRLSTNSKGIEQRLYAHYANISHILRQNFPNSIDPLDTEFYSGIDQFKSFVNEYLLKTGTINFYEKLYLFKNNLSAYNILFKILLIPFYFKNFDLIKRLLLWRIRGDSISYKMANDWIKK